MALLWMIKIIYMLEVIFADYEYSPEYVAIVDDNTYIIKDPAFKYFYFT